MEGRIGKVDRIYGPGEFVDKKGRMIPQVVTVVDMGGEKMPFLLPPTGKQFSQLSENVATCLDIVRRVVDSTITDIVGRLQKDAKVDETTAMLVVGSAIRERMQREV